MKLAKRFIALAMAALMLVSSCMIVSASATVSMAVTTNHVVVTGVDYAKYSVYGSQSKHTETATVLEFNPANGYIPMAFASNAGSCNVLSTQYSTAVNKYGYEVAGVINGSYFDMASGTLSGILISGGKVSCADIGYSYGNKLSVVAFGTDGSMNVVDSQLSYRLYINGTEVPDALRFINKIQSSDSWKPDSIFYYDTSCGTTADTSGTGYEVICQKIDGSDLTVGGTMQAKVVEVRSNTSGTQFESDSNTVSDKFVLFAPKNGSYASYLSSLSAGDTIEISIEETIAASKEIMENASSVITNVGWLVKDGVDQTDINSVIGDHSVTGTYARWTAFGQKADGTYVFFTSEGGDTGNSSRSLTLKDVAAAMIQLGCVNVIRMDGGGSSAMYVSNTGSGSAGYVQSHSRAVADCILIIKNPDKTSSLKAELKAAIEKAEAVSHTNYTEATLQQLRAAYESAKVVYNNANATESQITAATNNLNALIAQTGSSSSGSQGSTGTSGSFWLTHYNDNQEGAGVIFTQAYTNGEWNLHFAFTPVSGTNAYKITAIQNGLADGSASPLAIPSGGFVYTLNSGNDWSQIGDSSDGDINYTSVAVQAMIAKASEWKVGDMFVFSGIDTTGLTVPTTTSGTNWYDSSYVCTATYAPYTITSSGTSDTVSDGVYITGFNTPVTAGSSVIFTPAFNNGRITVDNANHRWTTNVICTWNSSAGGYVVTSVDADKGENGNTEDIVLSSNQILIAAHNWESEVPGSELNEQTLATAEVGQVLCTYGVDISNCYLSAAPYVRFLGESESDSGGSSGGTILNGKMFWLTHYNDLTVEGAGVIVTASGLEGGSWNNYYAFAPVAGTDAYEIVEISIGIGTGTSSLPAIPAGGFVYSINVGNNYPEINKDGSGIDYTSDNCNSMIAEAANWQVDDQFVFSGIDLVGNTVPTSTSDANWYDDAYVCTAVFAPYGITDDNNTSGDVSDDSSADDSSDSSKDESSKDESSKDESDNGSSKDESKDDEINDNLGDVNLDGKVDQFDYVLVKRHYFNTYVLSGEEAERADVNLDNVVDQFDYVLLKRVYFNTYTLPNKNA